MALRPSRDEREPSILRVDGTLPVLPARSLLAGEPWHSGSIDRILGYA